MGEVYARRLIAAGFSVIGFDIDPAKNERLEDIGGRAGYAAEIAQECDPIVLAVFNTDQVEDVVEQRAIARLRRQDRALSPRPAIPTASRRSPRVSAAQLALSGNAGVGHERAGPPGRRRRPDRRRCGRSRKHAAPVLDALFPKRFHIGKAGDGGRAKLAVNLILGLNRMALAEGSGVRRAPRARSGGVPRGRARLGGGLAGDGHQGAEDGRAAIFRRRATCARHSRTCI